MALQYPLLFSYGEDGYEENIPYVSNTGRRKTQRGHVTMREYYSYRIQQRDDEGWTLLMGGGLFQQYLVDAFCAIEEWRLKYIRRNQANLRADLYQNICDAVTREDTKADAIGKRVVLPSSFTGSPSYMIQNYQDAMAICRTLGNPDLFITFTANPKWPEISYVLLNIPGQRAEDRPDVVTRLFKLKLDHLMKDIQKNNISVSVQQFQKRGLPHAHILVWLNKEDKCKTPCEIDDIISAEIPHQEHDMEGHRVVTEYMLHGPCGKAKINAPCMKEGKCSKHFPKRFNEETSLDESGFPVYRRRNNGEHVVKMGIRLDNRFVTPYNCYLLLKYRAHVNVEWCNRSRAIKYLFKYLNKGPDKATTMIQENIIAGKNLQLEKVVEVDEVKQYLDCRYVSGCEAVWRTFAFDIHYCSPSVMRLSFHLEKEKVITMQDSQSLPALLKRQSIQETMFTQWLRLNEADREARNLCYAELPSKYVWHESEKEWRPRKQGNCIGRIYYTHPTSGEQYYLRMLLNIVRGPGSFKEIRTVNGKEFQTFKEACHALGMINDDKEWNYATSEAKLWASPLQLRQMFVTILLFYEVSSPRLLWENNWEALSDDVLYRKRIQFRLPDLALTEMQIRNYCLADIQEVLNRNGKSLADFKDPPMPDEALLNPMDNRLIREELNYSLAKLQIGHERLYSSLNVEQIAVYNKVVTSVNEEKGEFFFVYGPRGTGKTFLYKALISRLRSERRIVLAVASSGIASLLLPGGRTTHSRFVMPLELMENSTCGIKQNTHLAALMNQVSLIIWDGAPVTQRYAFEALDRTLKDILGYNQEGKKCRIFGVMTVLLGGDFRQILPVIPKGGRQEIVQSCINNSHLWKHCRIFTLTRSMRVNEIMINGDIDLEKKNFNKWVIEVGDGVVPAKKREDEAESIELPSEFIIHAKDDGVAQIVSETYPNFIENQDNEEYLHERAILTPLNEQGDEINAFMFEKLQGSTRMYRSSDEICKASTDFADQDHMFPIEFLNSLSFPNIPPHNLKLKEGLPVMLLRNVNPSEGLCNGTRMLITYMGEWVIQAKLITGTNRGNTA